jgi:uncharacterized protein
MILRTPPLRSRFFKQAALWARLRSAVALERLNRYPRTNILHTDVTTGKPKRRLACPICRTPTTWEENPYRPFCSARCRLIDLGRWADGSYYVEGGPVGCDFLEEPHSHSEDDPLT